MWWQTIKAGVRWFFRWGEHAEFGGSILENLFGLRTWVTTLLGAAVSFIWTASRGWDPLHVWLAALGTGAAIAVIVIAIQLLALRRRSSFRRVKETESDISPLAIEPDIDAKEAFFQIFEKSEWTKEQERTTPDTNHLVRDWLKVRLDTEIHKALRNSRLDAWGEECLAGTQTTPEKPIPPDTWDKVEIVFDRLNLPRTSAHFKGATSREVGRMAWVGVKFSKQQIFQMFPLNVSTDNMVANKQRPTPHQDLYDQTVQWALHQIAKNPVFAGKLDATPDELRQAARNGSVTIYGRPDSGHLAVDGLYKPIEPISPNHWRDFGLDVLRCIFHDDPRECRTQPDDTRSARYGETYVDLRVNSVEIEARWPEALVKPSLDRIPLTELLKMATKLGWDVDPNNSLQLLDLQEAIRQGGLDVTLTIWGRQNQYPRSEMLMRQEPLDKIPLEHWREFRVDLFPAVKDDNFNVRTWRPTRTETAIGYIDLHVDRDQAGIWLRRDAIAFKGKTKS